jgi:hypothetical protein
MTDISPESAATPEADVPAPDPGAAQDTLRRASRLRRNPLLRFAAVVAAIALGWGAFQVAHNLWTTRNDNTPISSSSHAHSGALTVSGHGVTLTFIAGWVNVPTTPDRLAQFMRTNAAKLPHLRAALKNELGEPQALRNMAMLVYRINTSGAITGTTNVVVVPDTTPSSQLMPQIKGLIGQIGATREHDSLTTFGKYSAVLVTYMLPSHAGLPTLYGALAYVHGPASTPIITVTTRGAADATATLRQVADTIKFS